MMRSPFAILAAAAWLAAVALGGPTWDRVQQWGLLAARPFALPFLWRTLQQSIDAGDPAETFAKAQLLLEALPDWGDGYAVFAWRYAIDGGSPLADPAQRSEQARLRLVAALAMLTAAAERNPAQAAGLNAWMAFLVELAARNEPGLAARMAADPGLGDPAQLADRYLAEAERRSGSPAVREQRIFAAPRLCAALLQAADRNGALALLDATIERCSTVRDRELGAEWRATLAQVRRRLAGDRTVDPATFHDDQRLRPLLPWLDR